MKLWQFYTHRKQLFSVFFKKRREKMVRLYFIFEVRNRSRKTQGKKRDRLAFL